MKINAFRLTTLVFGIGLAFGAAQADPMAYVETSNDGFGQLDLSSGAYTNLGTSSLLLAGMGSYQGTIYGVAHDGTTLYSVNPANGLLTAIGDGSAVIDDFGSTTTGLYAVTTSGELYSINPNTGASTDIGSTGVTPASWTGMSSSAASLYLTNDSGGVTTFYSVNTGTGLASALGTTAPASGIGAMVMLNGVLYGGQDSGPLADFNLDPFTGAGSNEVLTPGMPGNYWGLAAVPEPSPFAVCGLGLLGLALRRRKR